MKRKRHFVWKTVSTPTTFTIGHINAHKQESNRTHYPTDNAQAEKFDAFEIGASYITAVEGSCESELK